MLAELQTIVICDGVGLVVVRFKPLNHGLTDGRRRLVGHTFEDRVFGYPFDHRHQDPPHGLSR